MTTAGDDFVAFQRFDRLGEEPTATTLEGRWSASTPTTAPDGGQDAEEALERAAQSIRYVAASPDGVTLHDGDRSQRISSEDTAVAFAIGSDIVVHQTASTTFPEYPPTPEGTPIAWVSGDERALPVSADARSIRLLDATVLIDIAEGTRRTVVRRPAWESAHLDAAVLPDGDVIGLFASESLVLLARWSPGQDDPAWVVEVAADSRPTFTTVDGQIRVVDAGFDEDFAPVLRIRAYDTDGQEQSEESVPVTDPDGELGAGLFCTGHAPPLRAQRRSAHRRLADLGHVSPDRIGDRQLPDGLRSDVTSVVGATRSVP